MDRERDENEREGDWLADNEEWVWEDDMIIPVEQAWWFDLTEQN